MIIDDGSRDNTVNIAESLGTYVVRHETNKGYGEALKTSFKAATDFGADIVVIMSLMDWRISPGISKLIDPIIKDEADIVFGISDQTGLDKNIPIYRRIRQIILDIFTSWDLNIMTTDSSSNFYALASTKDIFSFDTQDRDLSKMIKEAVKAGLRIKRIELGVGYDFDDSIKSEETQRTLIEKVKVTVSADSPTVRQIVSMVLPALDHNPRRIKQFLNLFRLKAFIASETGLFCISENTSLGSNLTLEKLGKFVAITLKWPLLISEIHSNPNLLDELQRISLNKQNNNKEISDEAKYWIAEEKLIDLLRYGCLANEGSINPKSESTFSLSNLNINKLLQTSPRIDRAAILTTFELKIKILETNFQGISDKKQAWLGLHRLVYDEDDDIRWRAAKVIGNAYKYLSENKEALKDLHILTSDKRKFVRVYANHSLGKISIFNASQAENEDDYKKELQKAIEFFEKSSDESSKEFNPSKFCFPFYRSFHSIIFKKQNAREDVDKYLAEAKLAIGDSKNEKVLLETIEKLANLLKEIEALEKINLSKMKDELDLYMNNCKNIMELIEGMEKVAPSATTVIRRSFPIIDSQLKEIINIVYESTNVALNKSKGTPTEEIARTANSEVQKWEIGNQEEMAQYVENLVYALESKIPNTPENKNIYEQIYALKNEKDVIRQYEILPILISLIPQVTPQITINPERMRPTIGIITALSWEYAAVKIMLENAKENSYTSDNGKGQRYCLGRISSKDRKKHDIVLIFAGTGNNAATLQAFLLLEHFPDLKYIISVGIGGGVPSPYRSDGHVRLGDIVVSNENGVIQYDLIKQETNRITYRNSPRPPSADLLEAARYLEAEEIIGNRPWEKYIAQALSKLGITRPPHERDILYSTDNQKGIILHPEDPKRMRDQPRVFMGPIASANILQKDPKARDELRDKFGVKAIEMEASGIADVAWKLGVSYLVVRGISDYCDSHKTDEWQHYAAVVAAAYTRALIESMP